MGAFTVLIIILGSLTVATLGTWLVIILAKKEDDVEDPTTGINFMAAWSEGRAYGSEMKVEKGNGDRYVITLDPKDINPNSKEKIKPVKVIVDKNKIISLPRGKWSAEKNINIYLPPTADDFPDDLKATPFGKMLQLYTEIINADNTTISSLLEGKKRSNTFIKEMAGGEATTEIIKIFKELLKDVGETVKEAKGHTKSIASSFTPPPTK